MKSDSVHCQDENDFKTVVTWQSKFKKLVLLPNDKKKEEGERQKDQCVLGVFEICCINQ